MLIESEDLKNMLQPYLKKYTIHFSFGDYQMIEGAPYFEMMKVIEECEKNAKK